MKSKYFTKFISLMFVVTSVHSGAQTSINPDGFSTSGALPQGSNSASIGASNSTSSGNWGNGTPGGNLMIGTMNTVGQSDSVVAGGIQNTLANQEGSFAFGFFNEMPFPNGTWGQSNIILGYSNYVFPAPGNQQIWGAILMGDNNQSSQPDSWVIGRGNIGQGETLTVGTYAQEAPNASFIVGIGTSPTARSNGLTVDKNGNVSIQGNLTLGGTITSLGSPVLTSASAPSILTSAGFVTSSPAGVINLTGTAAGISANGTSIFSLDGAGKVTFANNRPMNITSTNSSSSSTTGALVVAGGIGAAKDSFFGGVRIGRGESSGSDNTVLGKSALSTVNSTGSLNTAIGFSALRSTTTGSYNTAVGVSSLYYNTTGQFNTAFGLSSLNSNTTGTGNTANGVSSLYSNTSGGGNVAFGNFSGISNINGNSNSAFGLNSMHSNTSGSYNTALGFSALFSNTTGSSNVAIGREAGQYQANSTALTDPENSVYIGYGSRGKDNSDNNSIVIGTNAVGAGANTTVIGNSTTTSTRLFGESKLDSLRVSGQVIIEQPQGDISMGIYQ